MLKTKFGIEVEFTGITRTKASRIIEKHFGGRLTELGGCYDKRQIETADGRKRTIVSDASLRPQTKVDGQIRDASSSYRVEMVSPILEYEKDIEDLQELIRKLRKGGAFANGSCGIHIHLDGANHTARSIKNFINIIASKNDLLYKSLQVKADRMHYCKKMDLRLVESIKRAKPRTLDQIKAIWYRGYYGSQTHHYHESRYHFLNLHSFFSGNNHTVELRGFNSELHAGKIRSYIVLALALNHQALTQKSASSRKVQEENEKFAMRTYLNRIGFIGEEFKNCREHLCKHLNGSAAWRFGR